jgi:RNA polymerase sigma-70 factor (ECF subfamily)
MRRPSRDHCGLLLYPPRSVKRRSPVSGGQDRWRSTTTGAELSREAIRLGRLLVELIGEPEATGLVGLMLLQESRRPARTSPDGDLILLEQQDRSLWNKEQIAEGISLTESALTSRRFGAYTLQAAIAAVHAESSSAASTDWREIKLL